MIAGPLPPAFPLGASKMLTSVGGFPNPESTRPPTMRTLPLASVSVGSTMTPPTAVALVVTAGFTCAPLRFEERTTIWRSPAGLVAYEAQEILTSLTFACATVPAPFCTVHRPVGFAICTLNVSFWSSFVLKVKSPSPFMLMSFAPFSLTTTGPLVPETFPPMLNCASVPWQDASASAIVTASDIPSKRFRLIRHHLRGMVRGDYHPSRVRRGVTLCNLSEERVPLQEDFGRVLRVAALANGFLSECYAQFGGSPSGCASSTNLATERIAGSENLGPTICSPTGSLAEVRPAGTLAAGKVASDTRKVGPTQSM